MPDARPRVVVMVKVPQAGRVKTRLGRDIGMTTAAWWFRHQTARLLRDIRDPRWRVILAVTPDRAGAAFAHWPRDLPRLPQGPGDLGRRMARIFRSMPRGPALIIGADIPGITRPGLAAAFRALRGADAVIGPATDGGYWLIGLARPGRLPADAFAGVRWSGPNARDDTLKALAGHRTRMIHTLADVDTAADLLGRKPS